MAERRNYISKGRSLLGHTFYLADQLQVRCHWPRHTAAYVLFGRPLIFVLLAYNHSIGGCRWIG